MYPDPCAYCGAPDAPLFDHDLDGWYCDSACIAEHARMVAEEAFDPYYRRCLTTWESDARRTRLHEILSERIESPAPRYQWFGLNGAWHLVGTLPTIGPDGRGTVGLGAGLRPDRPCGHPPGLTP
jgi:hypothetical protein